MCNSNVVSVTNSTDSGSGSAGDRRTLMLFYLRCSSITFDLTDAEGYNRNRSKSRKRREKERKEKELKEESQANIFAREEEETIQRSRPGPSKPNNLDRFGGVEDDDDLLSKWSCRRCTLENPLQESVCMACGGSRLSSIGDIEVPKVVEPRNLVNLIREDDETEVNIEKNIPDIDNNNIELMKWKCKTCTLENEPFNYYCDACNSPNPRRDKTRKSSNQDDKVALIQNPEFWLLVNKVVR